ncbi:MAG TPA: hypothetical protein VGK58_07115 [Lacipirellulaceae bacterium]
MLKRALLALAFVAALGAAGMGVANKAEAGHGHFYGGYYGGYGTYYPSYYGGYGHGPRFSYYRGFGSHYGHHGHRSRHHGHHGHHGHGHRSGVSFSIGF